MRKIIIVYEYDYDDCDIVLVPNFVAKNVDSYSNSFLRWLERSDLPSHYYAILPSGEKCISCETEGFVEWLNNYVCPKDEQAVIVNQHIKFDERYPMVDF
jgi:hypothetical protein